MGLGELISGLIKGNEPNKTEAPAHGELRGEYHWVSFDEYASGGGEEICFRCRMLMDKSFEEFDPGSAEITLSYGLGAKGLLPEDSDIQIMVDCGSHAFRRIKEYREKGTFEGAGEIWRMAGRTLFRADCRLTTANKRMYFYALDRCGGFWEDNGICLIYPEELHGTELESRLRTALDIAANSYEERIVPEEQK